MQMMRKKISWLFLLTVFLSLFSCRNDLIPEQQAYDNSSQFRLTSKRISLNQSRHKTKLITELQQAEAVLKKANTSVNGKLVSYGNFIIDTDQIVYIENGPNYHTYTFRIVKKNEQADAPVENLIFTPLTDGTYRKLLVSYHLTPQEKQLLQSGVQISTKGKATVSVLGTGTLNIPTAKTIQVCGYVAYEYYTWCSENIHHNGEGSGECSADVKSHLVTGYMYSCEYLDTGGDNGADGAPSGTGSSGSGDDGSGSGGENQYTWQCPNPQVFTGPQQAGSDPTDQEGCYVVPTEPNMGEPQTPCEKIKTQRDDDSFKKRMDTLQSKTGLKKETGYIQKWGGSYEYKDNASATPTANSLSLPEVATNTYIKGFAHTHVDNYEFIDPADGETKIKIGIKNFSPADVAYFMDLIQNAQTKGYSLSDVYGVMISSGVNYQIRFTGNQYQIKTFTDAQMEAHRDPYTKFMESFIDNSKKLELRFLKYIDEKMNLKGITLYRMNADGTNTEIKLNADKTNTVETNCPN